MKDEQNTFQERESNPDNTGKENPNELMPEEKTHDNSFESDENEEANLAHSQNIFNEIKNHQNFQYALIGGLLAAIISALIWATISISSNHQFGIIAIAVGAFIGFSVRFFGAGIDKKFGILGATLSFFACVLGNLFTQIGFIAKEYSYGYFETLSYLDFNTTISILTESFSPIDLLF